VWDGELSVSIPLDAHRSPDRNVIRFDARGDYDIDTLRLTLEDDSGAQYVAFVDLTRDWGRYSVPMADFVKVGDSKDPALVDPAKVRRLSLGITYKVVWKDVKGSFSLGPVSLAKASRFAGVPSSSVTKWRILYPRSGAPFPGWVIDPFLDARRLTGPAAMRPAGGQHIVSGEFGRTASAWQVPSPPYFRGTEDIEVRDELKRTEMRRIPLLQTKTGATIAEVHALTGGTYAESSLILFGIEDADYSPGKPLGKALIAASDYVLRTPRIVKVTPVTTAADDDPTQICCRVTLTNPLPTPVSGRVRINVADGLMRADQPVALKPGFTDMTVKLGQVSDKFPMKRFSWRVSLDAGGKHDIMSDSVDVERTLIGAARYMMSAQNEHPDGRYSIYFFSDIYAARALFALGGYLRDPAVWKRNADLLAGLKPSDFTASAFRFCDMVVSRQTPEGGLPIGYAERGNLIFTADDGTIVLGLLQIASHMGDDARAHRYVEAARKYFAFRESLYITAERSKRLQEQYGKDAKGTREGLYGLGVLNSDMLKKGGERWPEPRIEERGISWVMPISMGSVAALDLLDPSNSDYHKVVLRDAAEIIGRDYPITRTSYFHVESLFWMRQAVSDERLRAGLGRKIDQFIPGLLGWDDALTYFQGRGTLQWLNLVYYQRLIADTPRVRALLLRGVWDLCSDTSNYSVDVIAERFPITRYGPSAGGYRCVSCAAISFMEMLKPGGTLAEGDNHIRGEK
jgi:hypothetical protein